MDQPVRPKSAVKLRDLDSLPDVHFVLIFILETLDSGNDGGGMGFNLEVGWVFNGPCVSHVCFDIGKKKNNSIFGCSSC